MKIGLNKKVVGLVFIIGVSALMASCTSMSGTTTD